MKIRILALISFITLAFTSCDLTSESNTNPTVDFVKKPFVLHGDTLNMRYTDEGVLLDTIQVGDTVFFPILINGYYNLLQNFSITLADTSSSKLIYPPTSALDTIFSTSLSDFSKGKFTFKTNSNSLYFPFRYVAKKASTSTYISFYIQSDAKGEYNQSSITLKTPIIAKVDTTTIK